MSKDPEQSKGKEKVEENRNGKEKKEKVEEKSEEKVEEKDEKKEIELSKEVVEDKEKDEVSKENEIDKEILIESVKGTQNGMKLVNGVYFPLYVENLNLIKSMKVRSDDIFIIGYPKSGMKWTQELVWIIKNNLDFSYSRLKNHINSIVFLEKNTAKLNDCESPRTLTTHLPLKFLPDEIEKTAKIIYILKNPKDMLVSTYNHVTSDEVDKDKFLGSFEEMTDLFLEGKWWNGAWWSHVDEYTSLPNTHVIHYENLIEKPFEEIKLLGNFLGRELSDHEIKSIIGFSSFTNLQEFVDFHVGLELNLYNENMKFFKKPKIGTWKSMINIDLSKKLDDTISKNLKYNGSINYGTKYYLTKKTSS